MKKKIVTWLLCENNKAFIQSVAVKFFAKHPKLFYSNDIQVALEKKTWKNCADIMIRMGYPKNSGYLDQMFEWLQDMNWPGASEIFNYLFDLPGDIQSEKFFSALQKAISSKDEDWVYFLYRFYQKSSIQNSTSNIELISQMEKIAEEY